MRIIIKTYKHPDGRTIQLNGIDNGHPSYIINQLMAESDLMAAGFKPVDQNVPVDTLEQPADDVGHEFHIDQIMYESKKPVAYSICRDCGEVTRCPF